MKQYLHKEIIHCWSCLLLNTFALYLGPKTCRSLVGQAYENIIIHRVEEKPPPIPARRRFGENVWPF